MVRATAAAKTAGSSVTLGCAALAASIAASRAKATASVSHRHLTAIHDVFMVPKGNLYVVAMPFLEGETLR